MPSKQIGLQTFVLFEGALALPGIELNTITRDGIDGAVYQDLGVRGKRSTIRTLSGAASTTAMAAGKNAYAAMQGGIYTAYDTFGNYASVLVHRVQAGEERRIGLAVGDLSGYSGDYTFETFWELEVL